MARTYSKLSGSREVLAILVETDSHDTVGGIESFFNTVSVVTVDIDVQNSREGAEEFENAENNVVDVAKAGSLTWE